MVVTLSVAKGLAKRNFKISDTANFIWRKMAYYVYMLTNHSNSVLYTGVTNNLERRLYEHKNNLLCNNTQNPSTFTKRYNCYKLVFLEQTTCVYSAIAREKQIKGWTRQKKNNLVETLNPEWDDLAKNWV